jgi:hypothetical protein
MKREVTRDGMDEALALPPRRDIQLFSARLPFLATLTLAPLYGLVDIAQQLTPGPDTAFSEFYTLPVGFHLVSFVTLYLAVWLVWYAVLLVTHAGWKPDHPLMRITEVRAARPVLRAYLALVVGLVVLLAARHALTLGVVVQAVLLLFTLVYAGLAPGERGAARRVA